MQNKNLRVRRVYDEKNQVGRCAGGWVVGWLGGWAPRRLADSTQLQHITQPPHWQVVLYVAYSTRFTGAADEKEVSTSRYRSSVCAVPVAPAEPALVPVAE